MAAPYMAAPYSYKDLSQIFNKSERHLRRVLKDSGISPQVDSKGGSPTQWGQEAYDLLILHYGEPPVSPAPEDFMGKLALRVLRDQEVSEVSEDLEEADYLEPEEIRELSQYRVEQTAQAAAEALKRDYQALALTQAAEAADHERVLADLSTGREEADARRKARLNGFLARAAASARLAEIRRRQEAAEVAERTRTEIALATEATEATLLQALEALTDPE